MVLLVTNLFCENCCESKGTMDKQGRKGALAFDAMAAKKEHEARRE